MTTVTELDSAFSQLTFTEAPPAATASVTIHDAVKENRPTNELDALIDKKTVNDKIKGITALHLAVGKGNIPAARCLIKKGADPFIPGNKTGNNCFHCASLTKNTEMLRELALAPRTQGQLDALNKEKRTALYIAAKLGVTDGVEFLLQLGARPEIPCGPKKRTALHIAAWHGHTEVIKFLAKRPDLLEIRSLDGATAFFLACQQEQVAAASVLKDLGSSLDATFGSTNHTGLHIASESGIVDFVALFKNRPDLIDATTTAGFTALHIASIHRRAAFVYELLQNGASLQLLSAPCRYSPIVVSAYLDHQQTRIEACVKLMNKKCTLEERSQIVRCLQDQTTLEQLFAKEEDAPETVFDEKSETFINNIMFVKGKWYGHSIETCEQSIIALRTFIAGTHV